MKFRPYMLSRGDTLGHYRILTRLRAGGMATLYLAQRSGAAGFTRPVAIKVIHPHLAENPRFVEMFVDEAQLSAKVDDPHVVHVEELGEASGTYFLVMEYVDGVSLAQLLRDLGRRKRGPSLEIATWITMQIAAGLHAAHEATDDRGLPLRIVHRDVSPHNVLLAFKGHVKLIDFGVAKAVGLTKDTQTGSLRGKIAYMPPEQAYGRTVDRRADIYALGIVLWEMLTMRRLFTADNDLALLERVRKPEIVPPSELVPGIPPALDEAVMIALAPDPARRPRSAEELRALLASAVPAAVGKTARDVAMMISALLPEQLVESRRRLSEALGASAPIDSSPTLDPNAQEALATMTIENPEATVLFEDERASASPPPMVHPARPPPKPMFTSALPAVLAVVLVSAAFVGALAVKKARTTAASAAPIASSSEAPLVQPPPSATVIGVSEPASPPPPASLPSTAQATPPTTSTSAAKHKPNPRGAKPAHTAPSGSVEMHGGVPIFNHGL